MLLVPINKLVNSDSLLTDELNCELCCYTERENKIYIKKSFSRKSTSKPIELDTYSSPK